MIVFTEACKVYDAKLFLRKSTKFLCEIEFKLPLFLNLSIINLIITDNKSLVTFIFFIVITSNKSFKNILVVIILFFDDKYSYIESYISSLYF